MNALAVTIPSQAMHSSGSSLQGVRATVIWRGHSPLEGSASGVAAEERLYL